MPKVPRRRRVMSSSSQSSQGSDSSNSSSSRRATYKRHNKPPYSYVGLISMAIMTMGGKATLADINAKLKSWFEFFNDSYKGWKDSIRHMLSNIPCFKKVLRCPDNPNGKGNLWIVDVDKVDKSFLTIQSTRVARSGEFPRFLHQHLGYPSIWELAKMTPEQRRISNQANEEVNSTQSTQVQDQTTLVTIDPDEQTTVTEQTTMTFEVVEQQTTFTSDDVPDALFTDKREKYTFMACLNLNVLADEEPQAEIEHHQEEQSSTYQEAVGGSEMVHTQEHSHRYNELLAAMPMQGSEMTPLEVLVYAALYDFDS